MRQGIRVLMTLSILSLVFGLCGCGSAGVGSGSNKKKSTKEDLESVVIEYVRDKYGFEPEIEDWYTDSFYNNRSHYVLLNDGNDQFRIIIDNNDNISDNYESVDIDEDILEWANDILPGAVYAHSLQSYYTKEQKYTGDVWDFFAENNISTKLTITYVEQSLDPAEVRVLLDEAEKLDVNRSVTLLSCPSATAAGVVWDKEFSNGYIDIIDYAPYIDESLNYDNPTSDYFHHSYDTRQAGDCLYCELVAARDNPTPDSEFYIDEADESISDICPTYMLVNNRSGSGYQSEGMEVIVFIPMSVINGEPVYQDYYGSNRVDNMLGVECSNPDDEDLSESVFSVNGEYAVMQLTYVLSGTTYFSVAKDD